jgi:16S rRNA (uracil1498-N3)-methyltransferase
MQLPFFYEENIAEEVHFNMSETSSRHIVQVLRMKEGEKLQITNGKGALLTAEIILAHKKKAEVKIGEREYFPDKFPKITIAVSLVKNTSRFEWFLEKATEIGLGEIVPLLCKRTEKNHVREDRMKMILVSALIQSRQVWLPELSSPIKFDGFIKNTGHYSKKFIAHCISGQKKSLKEFSNDPSSTKIILIGPEGDFTPEEIDEAVSANFIPVTLGENRLRTETAALVAAVLMNIS